MQRTAEQHAAHAEWMRRVAAGDAAAFELLYDEFADPVFSTAIGMLRDRGRSEGAAQDVWVTVWNAAGSFDPARGSVATWITTLAHRHVIELIRGSSVRAADRPGGEPGEEVRGAMAQLSPGQRRTLQLACFEGCTQGEVAERLAIPLGAVKTNMFQGMRRLRALLKVDAEDPAEP